MISRPAFIITVNIRVLIGALPGAILGHSGIIRGSRWGLGGCQGQNRPKFEAVRHPK